MQRHHLLPRQLMARRCFGSLFSALGTGAMGFDDFRRNGLLLPCAEAAVLRTRLPLHRGPHRRYNEVVIARVGQVEAHWSRRQTLSRSKARREALMRLALIQSALRRRLLAPIGPRLRLNRKDPIGTGYDFTELDAMAEVLWRAT